MAEANPAVSSFQCRPGVDHMPDRRPAPAMTGRPAEALESGRRAVEIYRQVARGNPTVFEFQAGWPRPTTGTQ